MFNSAYTGLVVCDKTTATSLDELDEELDEDCTELDESELTLDAELDTAELAALDTDELDGAELATLDDDELAAELATLLALDEFDIVKFKQSVVSLGSGFQPTPPLKAAKICAREQ